ncbi:glycosyltransferase family 1 protein [Prevotella communis]|uniref:glycosyltransferase n=1 Tax=Prevotella communis TaxID=2913614 RepID=UPI001EDB5008|nr:glycosyltransferase [Prevotella communis]UKK67567.1 glycosyltransferase family 1 protein [Prevotella communis]UKK70287.1 glycosyltransferase family 1 protein [Prevotella communis]
MKVLVFSHLTGGHHLEYLHHVYDVAAMSPGDNFVFLLPQSFIDVRDKFIWEPLSNVSFDYFEDSKFLDDPSTISQMFSNSYRICKYLGRYSKENKVDVIYSNHMIVFVPFAPIFIKQAKIVGVIYRIFLHEIDELSWKQKTLDRIKYFIMSCFKVYKRVLILNDQESADQLNSLYHTNKFSFLPDPYLPLRSENVTDIREQYNIENSKTLFVHFGAMNSNKGTIEILLSVRELTQDEKEKYTFFFAGRIAEDIREEFYNLYERLKDRVQIVVIDQYCDYDFFASLCTACNAILTPYKRTSQSSGLIGYASQFGKPVIAPSKGLLGNLVGKYKLGLLINDCTPQSLISAYKKVENSQFVSPSKRYCDDNSIESFKEHILKNINA